MTRGQFSWLVHSQPYVRGGVWFGLFIMENDVLLLSTAAVIVLPENLAVSNCTFCLFERETIWPKLLNFASLA